MERALHIFDEVVVAVGEGYEKAPLFTIAERVDMIEKSTTRLGGVKVTSFTGLLVDFATDQGVDAVVRGLRFLSDFEYEFQMALMNQRLSPDMETVFLMPREEFTFLSSKLVREVALLGGPVDDFVPPAVARRIRERMES